MTPPVVRGCPRWMCANSTAAPSRSSYSSSYSAELFAEFQRISNSPLPRLEIEAGVSRKPVSRVSRERLLPCPPDPINTTARRASGQASLMTFLRRPPPRTHPTDIRVDATDGFRAPGARAAADGSAGAAALADVLDGRVRGRRVACGEASARGHEGIW